MEECDSLALQLCTAATEGMYLEDKQEGYVGEMEVMAAELQLVFELSIIGEDECTERELFRDKLCSYSEQKVEF